MLGTTDNQALDIRANAFRVRATGGVRFVTGIDGAGNITWSCSTLFGNGWSCSSDRNLKQNLEALDGQAVLSRLAALPIYSWSPKGENAHIKHFGPMAQDFYAAFGLGDNDKMIGLQDANGVALAAIQGLHHIMQDKDAEIAALRRELATLNAGQQTEKREIAELRRLVDVLVARIAPDAKLAQAR